MFNALSRRSFLARTALGTLSFSTLATVAERLAADSALAALTSKTKVRVGKLYLGQTHPGWPKSTVDVPAEVKEAEANLAKLGPVLADIEFVDVGLVGNAQQLAQAKEKFKDVTGILVIQLTMGTGPTIKSLLELNIPVVVFFPPYSGHEWHIMAGLQREGRLIEAVPSSSYEELAIAMRPFRALHRLKEARVLHVSHGPANQGYVKAIKDKFGTDIKSLLLADLQKAYNEAEVAEAQADADRWIREAMKVVEPSKEDIFKGARMYIAMKNLLAQHEAVAITMNCLGMGLIDRGMGYPCLGFVRLNNAGLAGVCEADLKSTMTQLIFTFLAGKPGFVTDPVFDVSNSTIIHAHCVAATQMRGPGSPPSPYVIRSHLEDGKGASLQVKLPIGEKITMARLIGAELMLFSTGEAVDSPFVDRACRTKLTTKVENIERFLENWSCGLHRVVFYGDHTRDVRRFCRFMKIKMLYEGLEDLRNVPGLEWETNVHA
jgi:hypothetical protein